MKLQFKALSITLGLVALLGAFTSVNSSTPETSDADHSVEISSEETPVTEMEASEETDYDSQLEASEEMEGTEIEAFEETEDAELEASEEIENPELEASEEIEDAENAEIETPELEATEDSETIDQSSIEGNTDAVETEEKAVDSVDGTVPVSEPAQ